MLSNVIKKIPFGKARREILLEHDKIIRHICSEVEENEDIEFPFDFIVTRPSNMIWDRPSRKKLSASKSVSLVKLMMFWLCTPRIVVLTNYFSKYYSFLVHFQSLTLTSLSFHWTHWRRKTCITRAHMSCKMVSRCESRLRLVDFLNWQKHFHELHDLESRIFWNSFNFEMPGLRENRLPRHPTPA